MAKPQRELFQRPSLSVKPEPGRREPRLWIRRLVIWSAPGAVIREVTLRPGLNIVWSPDPGEAGAQAAAAGALGHGSGKSLLCRLLRYCLGEARFAPVGQRDSIAAAFREGLVGAEIIVDGVAWSVVRSIGMTRRHAAMKGANLDVLAAGSESNGLADFVDDIQRRLITPRVADLVFAEDPASAWLVALAWLTRDQESRLDQVLAWRDQSSDSDSPIRRRDFSTTHALNAVRALIGAIAPEEYVARKEEKALEKGLDGAQVEEGHRRWEIAQRRAALVSALQIEASLPEGPLAIEVLRRAATRRLAGVAVPQSATSLEGLRAEAEAARSLLEDLRGQRARADGDVAAAERVASRIRGELPGLTFSALEAEQPACPVCEVPIDRVLAEGCKLSHKLPDLALVRQRRENAERDLAQELKVVSDRRERLAQLEPEIDAAERSAKLLREQLVSEEAAQGVRGDAWYSARKLFDEIDALTESHQQLDEALTRASSLAKNLQAKRDEIGAHRDERAGVFQRASILFDAIVRELVGPNAQGEIRIDGNGLHPKVRLGGERSSAAIKVLQVIIFDLAALCLGIEGATQVPPFLIHDSPREADLGLSAYHPLFRLAQSLEEAGPAPLFQYIVTTTTRPPEDILVDPWLRLTIKGGPAEDRLLKVDLE